MTAEILEQQNNFDSFCMMRYHVKQASKQTSNDMTDDLYFDGFLLVRAVSCGLTYIDNIDTATTPRPYRCAFFESAFRDRRQTASKNRNETFRVISSG